MKQRNPYHYKMNAFKMKQIKNISYGLKKEVKLKPLFEKHFGIKFVKLDQFNPFDFGSIDKKIFVELKSRRVTKDAYSDTMIGYNKIVEGIKKIENGCEIYLCFAFTDCICYYKFEKMKTEWIGYWNMKTYYHIPISELINF